MKLISLLTYNIGLGSLCLIFSLNAHAAKTVEICQQEQKTVADFSRCLDGVKDLVDRELQTWVNNQTFILEENSLVTGRRSALEMFKRSQRNFITYRENNCRWQYLALSPGTGAAPAYKKCYVLLSKDRINELSKIKN